MIISWAGFRGAVSLAAALALPADLPARDLIVFLTFAVILVTLVGQGLTLPWLIRAAAPRGRRWRRARGREGAHQALRRPRSRGSRSSRRRAGCARTRPSGCAASTASARTASAPATTASTRTASRSARQQYQRLRRELLDAERQAVIEPAQRGHDHRGGDAARAARHRPRGLCGSTSSTSTPARARARSGRADLRHQPDREEAEQPGRAERPAVAAEPRASRARAPRGDRRARTGARRRSSRRRRPTRSRPKIVGRQRDRRRHGRHPVEAVEDDEEDEAEVRRAEHVRQREQARARAARSTRRAAGAGRSGRSASPSRSCRRGRRRRSCASSDAAATSPKPWSIAAGIRCVPISPFVEAPQMKKLPARSQNVRRARRRAAAPSTARRGTDCRRGGRRDLRRRAVGREADVGSGGRA